MDIEYAAKVFRDEESTDLAVWEQRRKVSQEANWDELKWYLDRAIVDEDLAFQVPTSAVYAFGRLVDSGVVRELDWAGYLIDKVEVRQGHAGLVANMTIAPYRHYVTVGWEQLKNAFMPLIDQGLNRNDLYIDQVVTVVGRFLFEEPEALERGYFDQFRISDMGLSARGVDWDGEKREGRLIPSGQLGWSDYDIHGGMPVDSVQCDYENIVILTDDGESPYFEFLEREGVKPWCRRCGSLLPTSDKSTDPSSLTECFTRWLRCCR